MVEVHVKVLLSGSHGLIGSALQADLERSGDLVVTLTRSETGRGAVDSGSGKATIFWDPARNVIDETAVERTGPFDAVVHLGGAGIGDKRWSRARKQELFDSRIQSTRLLVSEVLKLDPRPSVFVCASAVGIYGDRGDEILTEDSEPGSGFLSDLCKQWEAECRPAANAGIRVVNLRSGVVLTARGGALRRQLPIFRLALGGRLGSGRQYLSWISLPDEVRIIRRAIEDSRIDGPLNSTAPNPVTNAEFTGIFAKALRRPALFKVPRAALAVVFGAEMADEMVLVSQRVIPEKLSAAGHQFSDADLAPALAKAIG